MRMHRDHPASDATLSSEGNINPERPQRRLGAAQVAREGAGIFRPSPAVFGTPTARLNAEAKKISGGTRPGTALAHQLAHASSNWVTVDYVLDCGHTVTCVGAAEGAGSPERGFASRAPERKISHARQVVEAHATQRSEAMRGRVQQGAEYPRPGSFEVTPKLGL